MRTLWIPVIAGLILLYFLDAAIDINNLSMEMFIRNLFHFFTGFVVLGIIIWHRRRLRFKSALYLILALLLVYDIFDYVRNANRLSIEMLIHDFYVLMWGGVTGFFHLRNKKRKED